MRIDIHKIDGCYNCGKEQGIYYTFILEKSSKHVKLCKDCLKALTEGFLKICEEEGIHLAVKKKEIK